jgi:hypothetical protein
MKEEAIKRLLTVLICIGLALVIAAICLAVFGKLHTSMGAKGVMIIAATAGVGLLLLLPSKIFLTFLLMTNSKK